LPSFSNDYFGAQNFSSRKSAKFSKWQIRLSRFCRRVMASSIFFVSGEFEASQSILVSVVQHLDRAEGYYYI
jgi:hypothetical protein